MSTINRTGVKVRPTGDLEPETISRRISGQCDPEASSGKERRQYVAHDVDLDLFLPLELLPDDWVVEHAEFFCVELAVKVDRLPGVEDVNLTLRPHREKHAKSCPHMHDLKALPSETCKFIL